MNDMVKRGGELKITDNVSMWEDGEHEFLLVNPETIEAIGSKPVIEKAKQELGLN